MPLPGRCRRELYLEDGRLAGTVAAVRQGEETLFTVTAQLPPGLWRIEGHGTEGSLPLRVTEGGAVTLRCRFSRALTERMGAPRRMVARRCVSDGTMTDWKPCDTIRSLPPMAEGTLQRRCGAQRLVAVPWREDAPFPWTELFCFASVGEMAGRLWVFYRLDGGDRPVFSEEKTKKTDIPSTISCGDVV